LRIGATRVLQRGKTGTLGIKFTGYRKAMAAGSPDESPEDLTKKMKKYASFDD